MKFIDGAWLVQEGVNPYYTSELRDMKITDKEVTIYAPATKVRHRGDTLAGPLFTLTFSSPAEDVVKLKLVHFKKKAVGPNFDINEKNMPLKTLNTDTHLDIIAGKTTVRVHKEDWKIEYFFNNSLMTFSGFRGLGMMDVVGKGKFMKDEMNLSVGEKIYGLGERFTNFIRNGQTIDIWNEDGGTGTEQSYKNIPFYISSAGYGLLVNDPGRVSFEVGSEKVSKLQFSVPGDELEYMIFPGPTPKEILKRYTAMTGLPGLPPAWSFGLWLTTSFTTDYDEATVTSFVDGMAERDLPLHTFHFDCFWMKEYEWCNFAWDDDVFPDPKGMLDRLKAKGLRICVWINPYIGQKSPLYDEGLENGYFIQTEDGNPWQWDLWQPGMAIVDFTNPDAAKWYESYLEALVDMGVDAFKTDFGERIPVEGVKYHDGSDPKKMHNYYSYQYNKVVYELLERKLGKDEAVLFARSGSVGSQKFPVHWGGDCTSVFESMAESLRGGLSLCMSGFGFWSHDIGGFENTSTADVYKRWAAFGLMSSHSRLHGSSSYRVPWLYDEESCDVVRYFTKLKCSLMPYLYTQAHLTSQSGIPTMRSMFLEHPNDLVCQTLDLQYYLGDSLLVAPVFNEEGYSEWYLPKGNYTHLLSNEVKESSGYFREKFDYLSLPLYVKPNTILPMGSNDSKPDYDYLEGIEYHVYALDENVSLKLPVYNIDNELEETITLVKEDRKIILRRQSSKQAYIILHNIMDIADASSDSEVTESGLRLNWPAESKEMVVRL